jgi:hypothetical protein|tara:strand:- start:1805 stop:2131 length:327 start_codon:yes stop_codon:yes gene_type:complete
MTQTATIIENYVIEPGNMTRYELIYATYTDHYSKNNMCSITWLKRGRGGVTFTWVKRDSIYSHYALEKSGMNAADLAPILLDVKQRFPGSIDEIYGFDFDINGSLLGQ